MANLSIPQNALKTGREASDSRWMTNADKLLKKGGKTLQIDCQEHKDEAENTTGKNTSLDYGLRPQGSQF